MLPLKNSKKTKRISLLLEDIIQKISSAEMQDYIFLHPDETEKLLLNKKTILGVKSSLVLNQILIRKKAENKLPLFFKTKGIVYPPSINWEQCSSEATGKFKAEIIKSEILKTKIKIADLTGGFGVDSHFISKAGIEVDYTEPDFALTHIVQHNHCLFNDIFIQYHQSTAAEYLRNCTSTFDLVYIDPSRRNISSKKLFRFADCEPVVTDLLSQLFKISDLVLIKASPLLDINEGKKELIFAKKIIIVSVENDCKELLFLLQENNSMEPTIETYNLNRNGECIQRFAFKLEEEKNCVSQFGDPEAYLYEPNTSVMKSGTFKLVGKNFGLKKIHPNTHLYTSSSLEKKFPGRIFKIEDFHFELKNLRGKKANVITRNYPLSADELKKKLKITDGGNDYVIGFTGQSKKHIVRATRLV